MAYVKGIIPADKVPLFLEHLGMGGYAFRQEARQWQLGQVLVAGVWVAITVDKKGTVGLPEDLVGHAKDFLQSIFVPEGITDTQRLDFMLSKYRNVIVEVEGWGSEGSHHAVYVEEGFMADKQYPAVRFTGEAGTPCSLELKREAIDLAILETKGKNDEQ
jgi:hypothetical protein